MKKWIKIAAAAGAIMCGVGGITALAAMGLGAKPGAVHISEDGIRYISADSAEERWECWEDGLEHRWRRWEEVNPNNPIEDEGLGKTAETDQISDGQAQSFLPDRIYKIDIELLGGEVEIYPVSENEIQIGIDGQAQKRGVFIHEQGGELKVCQRRKEFAWFQNESYGTVRIGIPETAVISELECEIDAGTCTVENIQTRMMDFSTKAGVIEASGIQTEELDVSAGTGRADIEGAVERKAEGDCGVGELVFLLEGKKEDFNYDLETGAGTIQIGDSRYSGIGLEEKIDNRGLGAVKTMELEVGTGSTTVSFY